MIKLGAPDIDPSDIEAVTRVLLSGDLVQGREVEAFENELADYVRGRHVVAMANCTSALEVALRAVGVGPGDVVVTTAYSWVATANVIELVGAQPVFVDIDRATYNMDPERLKLVIDTMRRQRRVATVKAILPVHAFGYIADLGPILELANELKVPMIEDAACALGASLNGRAAGTIGLVGCLSFHPRKSLTTGEGGALLTDEVTLADFARSFRNHGQTERGGRRFDQFGHNYRMTDVMAALGRSQLRRLPQMLERRRHLFELYCERLEGHVLLPAYDSNRHAAQAFVVLLPHEVDRQRVLSELNGAGVQAGDGTTPIPLSPPYVRKYGYRPEDFPVLTSVAHQALALPLHSGISDDQGHLVADVLLKSIKSK